MAFRSRNTPQFWWWHRTCLRFVRKLFSASVLPPSSRDRIGLSRAGHPETAMRITRHNKSDVVELSDGSTWRIWPGDAVTTLQWLPTTEIDVADIEDEFCSHALIDRSDGSRVRVIRASSDWPVH